MNFRRLLFLVKVQGLSGFPYLVPGRRYLATSLSKPKVGEFVIFRDGENQDRFLVKKVVKKEGESYRVASTLPLAQMNENLAPVSAKHIEGKLIATAI